jgi:hypothetical protein
MYYLSHACSSHYHCHRKKCNCTAIKSNFCFAISLVAAFSELHVISSKGYVHFPLVQSLHSICPSLSVTVHNIAIYLWQWLLTLCPTLTCKTPCQQSHYTCWVYSLLLFISWGISCLRTNHTLVYRIIPKQCHGTKHESVVMFRAFIIKWRLTLPALCPSIKWHAVWSWNTI